MSLPPMNTNEEERLAALKSYHILDTLQEQDFDDLTTLAATICGAPIALISLVDRERQWHKSHIGVSVSEAPIEYSFCAHAIISTDDITIVEDTHEDERFKTNPFVTGDPNVGFYAGVPLVNEDGFGLGTLCVIDLHKRTLSVQQQSALRIIARQVMDKLELRRKVMELEAGNALLKQSEVSISKLNYELNLSNTRTKMLIQQAPVAMIVFRGDDLLIEDVNAAMLELLGKDAAILNKPLLQAMPELEGQTPYKLLCKVYTTGETYHGYDNAVTLNRNGKQQTGYYNFTYSPLVEDGQIKGVIDMAVDVTEQVQARKAEQWLNEELRAINEELTAANEEQTATNEKLIAVIGELKIAEENLQLAIHSAALGTWRVDAETRGLYLSGRAKELFGIPLDANPSVEDAINAIDPAYRKLNMDAIERGFAHHTPADITYLVNNAETGKQLWIRAFGRASVNRNNQADFFSGVLMDITEQVKDDQRKSDFIGMVSHELKTPLTSLTAYIQMVQSRIKEKDDQFVYSVLDKAHKQVNKMNILINGFLNVSRLESGKIQIDRQQFDMALLLKEVEEESIAMIATHILVFKPVEPTLVNADRNKIGQVINNMISNAVKYSPHGSTIQVACITIDDSAQVSVKDNGTGIAPQDQQKLFDRYYRVENNTMKTASGFGIGLYLCAEIIHRHDGKIWVESEAGKGAAFYFRLPIL